MDKPRAARPTIKFIDEYCASYKNLFPEVRASRHLSIYMSEWFPLRKTLPEIAKVVGLDQEQSLHHFQIPMVSERTENTKVRFDFVL